MSLSILVPLFALLIPILGIGLVGYQEWLKFRAKQQKLGASTQEVEETIRALRERLERVEQERDALVSRVQNLETIVTSEAWDALQDPTADAGESSSVGLEPPSEQNRIGLDTEEQAEKLARRLRA